MENNIPNLPDNTNSIQKMLDEINAITEEKVAAKIPISEPLMAERIQPFGARIPFDGHPEESASNTAEGVPLNVPQQTYPQQRDKIGVDIKSVHGYILLRFSRSIHELKITKKDARELARLMTKETLK